MEFQERRRSARVSISPALPVRLNRRVRLRLVDISASGVLLACDEPLEVNSTGRLRVVLKGQPCEGSLTIVREHSNGGPARLFGAAINSVDEVNRTALERFLERAP
jgi:c-di-GMP-binding flagellar brake protein YcgR